MEVIEILKELLKFRSITPDDDGAMNYIALLMSEFDAKFLDINGVKNLILSKKFGDGVNLCFAGHIDVVPPGDGWSSDPFEPEQKDGYGPQRHRPGQGKRKYIFSDYPLFPGVVGLDYLDPGSPGRTFRCGPDSGRSIKGTQGLLYLPVR